MNEQKSISIIEPDHDRYGDVDVKDYELSPRGMSTLFYNELMDAYNDAPVGAILIVPLPKHIRFFNLKNVFSGRGLVCGVDVVIVKMTRDADGVALPRGDQPAKIKKVTAKLGRIIDSSAKQDEDAEASSTP